MIALTPLALVCFFMWLALKIEPDFEVDPTREVDGHPSRARDYLQSN